MYISVNNTSQKRQGKEKKMFEKLLNENYRRNISNAVKVRIRFRKTRKKK